MKSCECHSNLHTHVDINTKTEFKEERRVLLEVIGPELQSIYDDRQIEVRHKNLFPIKTFARFFFLISQIEFVDMHFGTGTTHSSIDLDPYVLYDHLHEIRTCHRVSRSACFIVSQRNFIPEDALRKSQTLIAINYLIKSH